MRERNIIEISNVDLRKSVFRDTQFVMFAESGAMGEPGAVVIVTSDGSIFHCNYVYGDIELSKLCKVIPVLGEWYPGLFGAYDRIPEGWSCEYLGAGNHLLIRNDIYDEFKGVIGEDMDPSQIYATWLDIFDIITEHYKLEDLSEEERIQEDIEAGYVPFEDERVYVTSELVHGNEIPKSLHVKEGLFDDYRSYLAEMWCEDQATFVTYYFPVDDPLRGCIQNNEKAIEAYLIGQRKLLAGEEHHFGIKVLDTKEGEVYSVTVCVGQEDEYFCEAYL